MTASPATTGTCANCNGTGGVTWTSFADGICFQCHGTGRASTTTSGATRAQRLESIRQSLADVGQESYDGECARERIAQDLAALADPRVTQRALDAVRRAGFAATACWIGTTVGRWVPSAV